jgi:hypothetical protein
MFGACTNELSADGHVVDAEYGCGAHSDTPAPAGTGSPLFDPYDDGMLDVVEPSVPSEQTEPEAAIGDRPEAAVGDEQPIGEQSSADADQEPT